MLYADFLAEHGARASTKRPPRAIWKAWSENKDGLYTPEATTWVKVKNPHYNQVEGRRELFARRRGAA